MEQNEGRLAHIGTGLVGKTKSFAGAADGGDAQSSGGPRTAPVEFEREDSEPREARRERGGGRDEERRSRRERSRSRRRRTEDDDGDDAFGLGGLLEDTRKKR